MTSVLRFNELLILLLFPPIPRFYRHASLLKTKKARCSIMQSVALIAAGYGFLEDDSGSDGSDVEVELSRVSNDVQTA